MNVQEVMRSVEDRDKSVACDRCMVASERIMDLSDFHLKGSGWYKQVKKIEKTEEKKK
jgi:predicted nucleic acid-binding Zn ribbon protein